MSNHDNRKLTFLEDDGVYQSILKASRAIAFMFDPELDHEMVSPHIVDLLAGNYGDRLLSQTMLEDGIIHPEDVEKSVEFQALVWQKKADETVLRLKTPEGEYRWFRMVMSYQERPDKKPLCIGLIIDVDERMQYQEELRHQAQYDSVSGVYSRRTFLNRLQAVLDKPRKTSQFLFQFDIDRFKLINELYGTATGDSVLQHIGSMLTKNVRPGELYGRLRDDVFCLCLNREREEALTTVKKIHREIKKYPLPFRFFLSTGIVEIKPKCTDSAFTLCDKATLAQRSIKGNYLREYCFYREEMGNRLNREHMMIISMEQAIGENQFEPWFQPQYDMCSGKIIGAEALARWRHPTLGLIPPIDFIPLFERNGFIVNLDRAIWEQVCRSIQSWKKMGLTPPHISVNVSRVHLYDKNFGEGLLELCNRYDVSPSLLLLEITESAYVEQPKELFNAMKTMKKAGFRFAMDDFGSGYSSLNILKDIPVDLIKFDLRFLEGANNVEAAGQIILKQSVQLVKELGLSCVAEGVETKEQVQFLQDIGCSQMQGYFFAKPMPIGDFEKLLAEEKDK